MQREKGAPLPSPTRASLAQSATVTKNINRVSEFE